jgi:hypothetical protein
MSSYVRQTAVRYPDRAHPMAAVCTFDVFDVFKDAVCTGCAALKHMKNEVMHASDVMEDL